MVSLGKSPRAFLFAVCAHGGNLPLVRIPVSFTWLSSRSQCFLDGFYQHQLSRSAHTVARRSQCSPHYSLVAWFLESPHSTFSGLTFCFPHFSCLVDLSCVVQSLHSPCLASLVSRQGGDSTHSQLLCFAFIVLRFHWYPHRGLRLHRCIVLSHVTSCCIFLSPPR